jgi:hypothetical protein
MNLAGINYDYRLRKRNFFCYKYNIRKGVNKTFLHKNLDKELKVYFHSSDMPRDMFDYILKYKMILHLGLFQEKIKHVLLTVLLLLIIYNLKN